MNHVDFSMYGIANFHSVMHPATLCIRVFYFILIRIISHNSIVQRSLSIRAAKCFAHHLPDIRRTVSNSMTEVHFRFDSFLMMTDIRNPWYWDRDSCVLFFDVLLLQINNHRDCVSKVFENILLKYVMYLVKFQHKHLFKTLQCKPSSECPSVPIRSIGCTNHRNSNE